MHWASLLVGVLIGWLVLPMLLRMFTGGAKTAS